MTIENGNVADADELNAITNLQQVYTGTGFNSSATNTTDEQDHELDAVASTGLSEANYVVVKITGLAHLDSTVTSANIRAVRLKAQIKETGQSYADIVSYKNFARLETPVNAGNIEHDVTATYEIIAPLTTGMQTNGFQVKVFSESSSNLANTTATFTNINTTLGAKK